MTFSISTHRHEITTTRTYGRKPADNPQEQQQEQQQTDAIQQEQCNTSETVYHFRLWDRARKVYRLIVGQINPATPASP
jgi:hypothetical protein